MSPASKAGAERSRAGAGSVLSGSGVAPSGKGRGDLWPGSQQVAPGIVCVVVLRVLRVLASEDAASHLQLSPAGHALDHSDRLVSDHLDSFYEGIMRVLLVPIPL